MAKRPPRSGHSATSRMVNALDRVAAFEAFEDNVLPRIRKDIEKGLSADEIYAKYENLAAARAVTIALTDPSAANAMAAIKDVRDRKSGKATEKKEVTHRLARLPDEQLDALLLTELSDMEDNKKKELTPK